MPLNMSGEFPNKTESVNVGRGSMSHLILHVGSNATDGTMSREKRLSRKRDTGKKKPSHWNVHRCTDMIE